MLRLKRPTIGMVERAHTVRITSVLIPQGLRIQVYCSGSKPSAGGDVYLFDHVKIAPHNTIVVISYSQEAVVLVQLLWLYTWRTPSTVRNIRMCIFHGEVQGSIVARWPVQ